MADSQLKITCPCGEVGFIDLPWNVKDYPITKFMDRHHLTEESQPDTVILECACGSKIEVDCREPVHALAEWLQNHAGWMGGTLHECPVTQ